MEIKDKPARRRVRIHSTFLVRNLRLVLSVMLCLLAIILSLFLIRETWWLVQILWDSNQGHSTYEFIEIIVTWFLYFEFIALITRYFESRFHFPLRYFIYIGITAVIRLIIVNHEKPMDALIYSLAILVLLCALFIANTQLLRRS